MRKVLLFALTIAIALGGLGFAHAAVTESQDDLLIYATAEQGDRSVLEGRGLEQTFYCGEHLFWHTDYRFGGGTETRFVYDRKGIREEAYQMEDSLNVGLTGGMSASTNGAFFAGASGYGALFQAVASQTTSGGSKTMDLRLADYVDFYAPDFELNYEEANLRCYRSVSFLDLMEGQSLYGDGIYEDFIERFRFPVQEDHIVSVTITKDDMGRINGFEYYFESGPELHFASHVGSEGIWFVPIFRDEKGSPLPYESPEGHGLYFVPWVVTERYDTLVYVAPDFSGLRLLIPIDPDLSIDHLDINGEAGECRMLSREGNAYVLSIWDLTTGAQKLRLEVLPHDPAESSFGSLLEDEGYLLITAQSQLALVDQVQGQVLLTAPDVAGQSRRADYYQAATGDLHFDGQRLYLLDCTPSYHDGAFWTAVWQQDQLLYYGEYDCSLLRGNESWYYSSVGTDLYPIQWQ